MNWISWYNGTYEFAPNPFGAYCLYSFKYVNWSIAQVNYAPNPATSSV
jgi:hypothetical protein